VTKQIVAPTRHEYHEIRGLQTHCAVYESASAQGCKKPLILVAGLGCASWMYTRLASALCIHRTVYVYDPPGHGESEGRFDYPLSIDDLTEHLRDLMDAADLKDVPLMGHSLGGEVVFNFAARHPSYVCALIACAPTGIPENPKVWAQLARLCMNVPRERPQIVWPALKAYSRAGLWRIYWLATDQTRHQTGPMLARVRVPTLLLDGLADPIIRGWTVRAIQEAIPNAVVREVQGGTHALTDSHPKAVAGFTLDFLANVGC
jgi:pimeloyl-ACP methyl ester carboxylesterase